jgi:tripartite-type tricarboxylate transporter receptor subunit TctC
MVYPFAAGSAGDVVGRIFAARISELLGQPVIFENVGGAEDTLADFAKLGICPRARSHEL